MNPGVTEEVSKQVGGFMEIMRMQPLSLALVVMNFALVVFLFYSNNQVLSQRQAAIDQIIKWQQQTDALMANCVSKEVVQIVVDALERDRELYRKMLPSWVPPALSEQPKLQSFEQPAEPLPMPPL